MGQGQLWLVGETIRTPLLTCWAHAMIWSAHICRDFCHNPCHMPPTFLWAFPIRRVPCVSFFGQKSEKIPADLIRCLCSEEALSHISKMNMGFLEGTRLGRRTEAFRAGKPAQRHLLFTGEVGKALLCKSTASPFFVQSPHASRRARDSPKRDRGSQDYLKRSKLNYRLTQIIRLPAPLPSCPLVALQQRQRHLH